jgi:integrase
MKYSVKFYLKHQPGETENLLLRFSVTFNGQRLIFYTGLRCTFEQWDKDKSELKKNQTAPGDIKTGAFNAELTRIKNAVNDLFDVYKYKKITPTIPQLRKDLKIKLGKSEPKPEIKPKIKPNLLRFFEKYITDAPLSDGRKKHMWVTYRKIEAFDPDTTFAKLNIQYLEDFRNFMRYKWKQPYKNRPLGLGGNTIISELKRFEAFISYARKHGWTKVNPYENFTIGTEVYSDPVFIDFETERDKLINAEINAPHLSRVRDIFIMQSYIGCRVGDLTKLTKSSIIKGNIEYIASKSKDQKPRVIKVPLMPKALEILAKYDEPDGRLLPFISNNNYNIYLKELFKLVGLDRMVTVPDKKTRETVHMPLHEYVSTHMARRAFIGNLHRNGVKNEIIARMSGHAPNSRAFARYYNINEEDMIKAIKTIE